MTDTRYSLSVGRPAWIPTDTVCQEAREMASNGLTVAQIANCLVYQNQPYTPNRANIRSLRML